MSFEVGATDTRGVEAPDDRPVHVLHVDDDPGLVEVTAEFLERESDRLSVTVETDPEIGLERLNDEHVDCIVVDYEMPAINGLVFLDEVRANYPDLPVILFTGKGDEEIASEAISRGVTDYLQKRTGTEQYELLANRIEHAVEAHRTRERLATQEARFRKLIEGSSDMVAILDEEGRYRYVSPASTEILGYDETDVLGDVGFESVHPEDREEVVELFEAAVENPDLTPSAEFRYQHANGEWRVLEATGRNMFDDPDVEGFVVNARDVTERRERQQELEWYETIVETVSDGVYAFDADGHYAYINSYIEEVAGFDREEVIGESPSQFLDEDAIERVTHGIEELLTTGQETFSTELEVETADGESIPAEARMALLTEDGEYQGNVGIVRDITERKEHEQELEIYEDIVDSAPDAIYVVDEEFRFRVVNQALADALGHPKGELGGEPADLLVTEGVIDTAAYEEAKRRAEQLFTGDDDAARFVTPLTLDGETLYAENNLSVLTSDDDRVGLVNVVRNVTERRERERELERQNERLEEFTSVVSHDLRNPLSVATGRLTLAAEDCESEHLTEAERALDRMDQLVADLLDLAKQGELVEDPQPVALDDLVQSTWHRLDADANLQVTFDDATVRADRNRLAQVFENLFGNAVEHAGPGMTVEVGLLDDRRGFYVADDGPGIPGDAHDDIFEHGYTTSDDGTGFGLSIVEEIVEAHGWDVNVDEADSGGARFTVTSVVFEGSS